MENSDSPINSNDEIFLTKIINNKLSNKDLFILYSSINKKGGYKKKYKLVKN